MTALDRMIARYLPAAESQGEWHYVPFRVRVARAEHDAARAELALLRRCRDVVVGLVACGDATWPWWYLCDNEEGARCLACRGDGSNFIAPPETIEHMDGCEALAIDALAKEVGDG